MFTGISAHSLTKRLTGHVPKKGGINEISTHSLTKRLTGSHKRHHWNYRHFNSQPHEEADPLSLPLWLSQYYFNSQPHEEADEPHSLFVEQHCKFQLTASRRGWQKRAEIAWERADISTHSLTKRLTCTSGTPLCVYDISTHSLTKRLTIFLRKKITTTIFQLTASRRGWLQSFTISGKIVYFNSQPHEEAD